MSKNIRIIFLRTLQLRAHAKKTKTLKGPSPAPRYRVAAPGVHHGRRSVAASEASQRRWFAGGVAASQRRRHRSVGGSLVRRSRSVGGSPGASQRRRRRSVGASEASQHREFAGSVAASEESQHNWFTWGVAGVARRTHRSVGGSPGASQRRSVAPRRLAPFPPALIYHPSTISFCFPFVLHLKCPFLEDPLALFEQLDADGGGELSLQERNAFRFCLPNCWNDRGLWQELDEDAGLILHHFQEYTVAKYKRGVEDYAVMAGMVGLGS